MGQGTRHLTRRLVWALAVAAALALAGAARAEEPGHEGGEEPVIQNWWSWDYGPHTKDPTHHGWPPPFGYALINFVIFAAVMYKLAAKPLRTFVSERHTRIRTDLDEAKQLRDGAQAMLNEYQKKVENADAEVTALLESIRAEAELEKARMIAAAEAQALRLKADAEQQIALEIERARNELRRSVIEAAVASAEEILKKQIGADDQRKMSERYVTELEQSKRSAS